ncbi:MAG: hypothetical protein HY540_00825 [Deltaproteobacteria bacterium]|nr:hypothetical protein [Deltaproteobacteria bacterium]
MVKHWQQVALAVVSLMVIGLVAGTTHFERRVEKQKVLFYQLQLLRTSVQLFKVIHHRNPHSLEELVKIEYRFTEHEMPRKFLEFPPYNFEGKFVDPFGTLYSYDAKTGQIKSLSKGFQYW